MNKKNLKEVYDKLSKQTKDVAPDKLEKHLDRMVFIENKLKEIKQ